MRSRTLSRTFAVCATACALLAVSVAAAVANPGVANRDVSGATLTSGNVTTGTDVAAPDQQNPIPQPAKPVLQGPPTYALHPQTLTPPAVASASSPSSAGFQWDDAGIGAGGALAIVLGAFGAFVIVRRRTAVDPPLAA